MPQLDRDTCEVINAACSFGRVCLVASSLCPRHVEQSKQKAEQYKKTKLAARRFNAASQLQLFKAFHYSKSNRGIRCILVAQSLLTRSFLKLSALLSLNGNGSIFGTLRTLPLQLSFKRSFSAVLNFGLLDLLAFVSFVVRLSYEDVRESGRSRHPADIFKKSLLSFISNAYGRDSFFAVAAKTSDSTLLHRFCGFSAFKFIICCISVTGFVSPVLGVVCGL